MITLAAAAVKPNPPPRRVDQLVTSHASDSCFWPDRAQRPEEEGRRAAHRPGRLAVRRAHGLGLVEGRRFSLVPTMLARRGENVYADRSARRGGSA